MKKYAIILMSFLTIGAKAQVEISVCKDLMNDKYYASPSETILCYDEVEKKGFNLSVWLAYEKEKVRYNGIIIKSAGIGYCLEKSEIIILFEDGSKYTATAWNDYNCEGNSYFDLYTKDFDKLKKKISAIRFTNGRSSDSYTQKLDAKQANYFIDVDRALQGQRFTIKNCD